MVLNLDIYFFVGAISGIEIPPKNEYTPLQKKRYPFGAKKRDPLDAGTDHHRPRRMKSHESQSPKGIWLSRESLPHDLEAVGDVLKLSDE